MGAGTMKMLRFVGFLIFVLVPTTIFGRAVYRAVPNERVMYHCIETAPFAAVLFYKETKQDFKDKQAHADLVNLKNIFKDLTHVIDYNKADGAFLAVNVGHGTYLQVFDDYSIKEMPALLLFSNGTVIRDENNQVMQLTGELSYTKMREFIDAHLKDDITDLIQEKKNIKREQEEKEREEFARSLPYWYYDYGWPYYGWFPYYRTPGIYFGIGMD
jgi:hypothetical protein